MNPIDTTLTDIESKDDSPKNIESLKKDENYPLE